MSALLAGCLNLMAQSTDSVSHKASFGVDYTGEVQTNFERTRTAHLLQLHADVPLSRTLSVQMASISTLASKKMLDIFEMRGYSNIETYGLNIPFALTVAGITWQPNDHHSLFAGIRRTDEDYFCSDGLGLFTNSSCGIFPTISWNFPIGTFPYAAMGIHYVYNVEKLSLQASLYNGVGNYRFTGRDNVFRVCPKSDGVFAMGQVEYRYRGSHYFLGGSMHTLPFVRPTVWAYAEQALSPDITLLAAYGHAFGGNISCKNFCGIGGKITVKRAELGLFTDYTRVADIDEWGTELVCNLHLTHFLTVTPVVHVITTNDITNCVGLLRMNVSF